MGLETVCRVSCPAGEGEAKALLESTEVLVRGPFRWKVPFAELQSVDVIDGKLLLNAAAGLTALSLGETVAAKWAEKIRNPPSLMKKLGVKTGCRYLTVGPIPDGFADELETAGAVPVKRNPDLVFAFAESQAELAAAWRMGSAVWVVYLKGRKDFTEGQVIAQGRAMGMMDTKVASFSPKLTALRFSRVIGAV